MYDNPCLVVFLCFYLFQRAELRWQIDLLNTHKLMKSFFLYDSYLPRYLPFTKFKIENEKAKTAFKKIVPAEACSRANLGGSEY
ncbi:hypothetical protein BpHYR1_037002 [Brachionus plicatilis]|uniref:Uncharacterized protein n=1 Tax=Brachionus plicatilis TaxID=10195 RepID=A0A3M7SY45_BRAPC|nr:hypothetical protein BpHYR1_037002 [Brachionus plicatilis]